MDLDDSLFRSARRLGGPHGRMVATKADGTPYSYMPPASERFFAWLTRADRVIPNTARTTAALSRVRLPFVDYRICALGGVILRPDGTVDPEWDAEVGRHLAALSIGPEALAEQLMATAEAHTLRLRVVRDNDRSLYLSARDPQRVAARVADFAEAIAGTIASDWRMCPAEHDVVIRPKALGKRAAQRWLRATRLEAAAVCLGIGDRLDDAGFLSDCDFVITPPHSELWQAALEASASSQGSP